MTVDLKPNIAFVESLKEAKSLHERSFIYIGCNADLSKLRGIELTESSPPVYVNVNCDPPAEEIIRTRFRPRNGRRIADLESQLAAANEFITALGFDPENLPTDEVDHYEQCQCCQNFARMEKEADGLAVQLAAANAKIAELEAAMQWRDISTAPKDGTPVLLLLKEGVVQGLWGENESYSGGSEEWGVLHLGVHGCGCCSCGDVEPLGWMPTPSAQEADHDSE